MMNLLGRRSRILVVCAMLVTLILGALIYQRQNAEGGMGGHISWPKLAWLLYTVFVWMLLCPILAFERSLRPMWRVLVAGFAAMMLVRAALEFPMLFVWKNWRPPYGMGHDLACAAFLAGGLAATRATWWPVRRRADRWMLVFIAMLIVGVLVECVYAWLFFRAVHGATTGDQGIWFAAPGDPRFQFINRLTLTFDLILYAVLLAFLAVGFRSGSEPEAEGT